MVARLQPAVYGGQVWTGAGCFYGCQTAVNCRPHHKHHFQAVSTGISSLSYRMQDVTQSLPDAQQPYTPYVDPESSQAFNRFFPTIGYCLCLLWPHPHPAILIDIRVCGGKSQVQIANFLIEFPSSVRLFYFLWHDWIIQTEGGNDETGGKWIHMGRKEGQLFFLFISSFLFN